VDENQQPIALSMVGFVPEDAIGRAVLDRFVNLGFRVTRQVGDDDKSSINDPENRWCNFFTNAAERAFTEFNHWGFHGIRFIGLSILESAKLPPLKLENSSCRTGLKQFAILPSLR